MATAKTSSLFTEEWLSGYDGLQFYTRTWAASNPKAVLLYVHGFGDHISRYDDVHYRWPERGITLFAYDLRGFGRTALDDEHRSSGTSYGKTNRKHEVADVDWWVNYLSKKYAGVPLFLMGYSAGGGLTLEFATRLDPPAIPETLSKLSGIIANAPLVQLTHPTGQITRCIVTYLGKVIPNKVLPISMPEERFSRRLDVVEALKKDPLRRPFGTLKGLGDMVIHGEQLLKVDYRYWPKDLPLLITHGTADKVNCPFGAEAFYNKLDIKDKKLVLYPDALHELVHEAGDLPDRVMEEYFTWIEAHIPWN